jgi:hypothetical protein
MRPSLRSRALAFLLAALFIGGVGGTSDLDALLFHRAGAAAAGRAPHVEASSGCHAERCLLVFRLASGRVAPPLGPVIRFVGLPVYDGGSRPAAAPRRADGRFLQQSRAPPAPPA